MRRRFPVKSILLLLALAVSFVASSQFKVVGYVHLSPADVPDLSKISFQHLTHLNIAFVNPDSTGKLVLPAGFDTLIKTAHQYNVKVLASLGGGSHNPYIASLLKNDASLSFVESLLQLTRDYQLEGIDVDLEGDAIDENYGRFIADLSAGLKAKGKLLTAAFATWNAETIPTSALKKFDFINVMSYDQTGPWRPEKPGPHSTYIKAVEDLHYWTVARGLPKHKLNLGLPFYGYCFGTTYGESMSYADIITNFPGADSLDVVVPGNGGIIHYNGLPTIQSKTRMAVKQAGGVMIWQLLQDAADKASLLLAIDSIVKGAGRH